MNLEVINPLKYPGWDELLLTNKNSSFFHTSFWAQVLSESYGYEPLYFTAVDNGKLSILISVMEVKSFLTGKRGVSLPFTDLCEPIIAPNFMEDEVWDFLIEYGEKAGWKYIEIRGGDVFEQCREPSSWYYEHILDLSQGVQEVFSHFRSSNKRNIKKAEKAGVEVTIYATFEAIREFYRLNCITRRMHGLPPQPFSFFEKIHKHIIKNKHGFLVVAHYREQAIAASVFFHFRGKAIYKYGASDISFQNLRPNNLVMWKAIEWYCQNGYSSFTFGRTDARHDGLRQFKNGWGTEERKIRYFRYNLPGKIFVSAESKVDGWHTSIFKNAPIPLLRIVGKILYKHMG